MRKGFILFAFLSLLSASAVTAETLTISVKNISPVKGKLLLALCNSREEYKKKSGSFMAREVSVTGPIMSITIKDVPEGEYAVKIIHDENSNGKLDTSFIGIPKEGFGFSNTAKVKMGPPSYEKAKFSVRGDSSISMNLIRFQQ